MEDRILITYRGKYPYMSMEQLSKEFSKSKPTIWKRVEEMRKEIRSGRYPETVIAGDRVSYAAFVDFLTYKKRLEDKNLRKTVPAFNPGEVLRVAGFEQVALNI